jgi:DHA2 family multidrug resistance protein-like MFS transporter
MDANSTRATKRDWIGLLVIALPCLLYSMDLTVLNLAVPSLSAALRPTSAQLLWIIDIYGFVLAGSLITMGTLGDRIGRRRLLLIGAAAFGLTSVVAAFSTSASMLIASRAVLGLAGATLAPSTLSLIRHMFRDPQQRTVAVGLWITSYSVGGAIGPLIGGILLAHFWWGSVFLVGVPVMVLLLALGPLLLPELRDREAGRLDLISAALSLAAVLAMIYGLKHVVEAGITWLAMLAIAVGLGAGLVFVRRQRHLKSPLIELQLFRTPAFSASLITYALATFVAFGVFVFVAQYLQLVLGLSPLRSGVYTTPFALAFIIGSLLTPPITRRVRPVWLIAVGLVVAAIGFALLAQLNATSGATPLVIGLFIYSLGLAPVFTLATDQIIGSAPPERAGAAAALSETASELGGALGIAILGSIGAAVYRGGMTHAVQAIPIDSIDGARATLGAALAVAAKLPGHAGVGLASAARDAFVSSLRLASLVAAVVVAGLAAVQTALRRGVAVASPPSDAPPASIPTSTSQAREPLVASSAVG